jgi:hypothetical protein
VIAPALAAGGLATFPVYSSFYSDANWAAEGGRVGYCDGILPLAHCSHVSSPARQRQLLVR